MTVTASTAALALLREHEAAGSVFPGSLANLFIVSHVALAEGENLEVRVARADGAKCERYWTWSANVGRLAVHPGVCERCADVLGSGR